MCLILAWLPHLPNMSTLSSLSWGLVVLSFLALLAGLYALHSVMQLLRLWILVMKLQGYPMNSETLDATPSSRFASPELLMQMVARLERGLGRKQIMALVTMWLTIAVLGLYIQTKENSIRGPYHNVEVISKDADRVYTWQFPDQPQPTTVRICPQGDDLPLVPGMVIDPLNFIQRKDCILINGDTFVDWKRNKRRDVIDKNGKILFAKES